MRQFSEFALPAKLQDILASMNYISATKIQEEAIPLIMDGRDILASSKTGSGKTAAFLIPLVAMMEKDQTKNALIIAPTRELAKQIYTVANQMLKDSSTLLIGGEDMSRQIRQLKQRKRIIIGTPGRINDHLLRKSLHLNNTNFLVLDETDRMLDMGFGVQVNKILTYMPVGRQTILLSATLPKAIIKLSEKYLNNPAHITVGNPNVISTNITQNVVHTEEKFEHLIQELDKISGSILIFVRTQRNAEKMKIKLRAHKYKIDILHGGLRQSVRSRVMKAFRNGDCNILVATDIASRGLDVPHIEHVINYDLPDSPEDYIHRIGRTARAEKTGIALSIISSSDKQKWKSIERMLIGKTEENIPHNKAKHNRSGTFKKSRSFRNKTAEKTMPQTFRKTFGKPSRWSAKDFNNELQPKPRAKSARGAQKYRRMRVRSHDKIDDGFFTQEWYKQKFKDERHNDARKHDTVDNKSKARFGFKNKAARHTQHSERKTDSSESKNAFKRFFKGKSSNKFKNKAKRYN